MPYAPFFEKFREIAERETRSIIVNSQPGIPPGEYGLLELYCDEPGCDCRRVFLNVFRVETRTVEAVIAFGWEPREFYVKWMGDDDPIVTESLIGPALNLASERTLLSEPLLDMVAPVLKFDRAYVDRLKRHYAMYRESIDRETADGQVGIASIGAHVKVGRNDPCPCGSGKKYKRCCGA